MEKHTPDQILEHCRAMMAMMQDDGMGTIHQSDGMMGGMMPMSAGTLLVGLAWIALVVAIAATIVWLLLRHRVVGGIDAARRSLDLRYAQGQVDRDTYLGMRADLDNGRPGAR